MRYRYLFLFLVCAFLAESCQKKDRLDKEDEETQDDRAEHNARLAFGVGDVQLSGSLRPSVLSQEFGFLHFEFDTLTYFGATNANAALTDINMMVYSDHNNDAYFLVEFDVERGLMRHGAVVGNVLSPWAFERQEYAGGTEVRLVTYDAGKRRWETQGSIFVRDGKVVANSRQMAIDGGPKPKETECDKPAAGVPTTGVVGSHLQYLRCFIGTEVAKDYEALRGHLQSIGADAGALQQLGYYAAMYGKWERCLGQAAPVFDRFKAGPQGADKNFKDFDAFYMRGNLMNAEDLTLAHKAEGSYLVWDDQQAEQPIVVNLLVTDAAGAYSKSPVYVDAKLSVVDSSAVLYEGVLKTDQGNGILRFEFDPKAAGITGIYGKQLEFTYNFAGNGPAGAESVAIAVVDNQPAAIDIVGGNMQSAYTVDAVKQPLRVAVKAKDGRSLAGIPVWWEATNGGELKQTSTTTNGQGIAENNWTTGRSAAEPSEVTAYLKRADGTVGIASAPFTYVQKKDDIALAVMGLDPDRGIANVYHMSHFLGYDLVPIQVVRDGGELTMYPGVSDIILPMINGKVLYNRQDGVPIYPLGMILNWSLAGDRYLNGVDYIDSLFKPQDLVFKDIPIFFYRETYNEYNSMIFFRSNQVPSIPFTDSIKINLRADNSAYRKVVGKTLTVKTKQMEFNQYPASDFSVTYNSDGTLSYTDRILKTSGTAKFNFGRANNQTYTNWWLYKPNSDQTYNRFKKVIGETWIDDPHGSIIRLNSPSTASASLYIYSDLSIAPVAGTGVPYERDYLRYHTVELH